MYTRYDDPPEVKQWRADLDKAIRMMDLLKEGKSIVHEFPEFDPCDSTAHHLGAVLTDYSLDVPASVKVHDGKNWVPATVKVKKPKMTPTYGGGYAAGCRCGDCNTQYVRAVGPPASGVIEVKEPVSNPEPKFLMALFKSPDRAEYHYPRSSGCSA